MGAGAEQKPGKSHQEPLLLVITSVLGGKGKGRDGKEVQLTTDGEDHPDQRVYPWLNRERCKTKDGLVSELTKMIDNLDKVRTGYKDKDGKDVPIGTVRGFADLGDGTLEQVEVEDMPDPYQGEANAYLYLADTLEKAFKQQHQIPMRAKLVELFGAAKDGASNTGIKKRGESALRINFKKV